MNLISQLLETAERHCATTGMSEARLATIVVNDGKFFTRLRNGGGCTVGTYERFMAYFAKSAAGPQRRTAARPTAVKGGAP